MNNLIIKKILHLFESKINYLCNKRHNIIFFRLYEIYKINKYYKFNNFVTTNIIYNNNLYICKLIIDNLNRFYLFYFYIIFHSFLHINNLNHKSFKKLVKIKLLADLA